jgi:hypothetical protein
MSEQRKKTHLSPEELENARNIAQYVDLRFDRASEMLSQLEEVVKEHKLEKADRDINSLIRQIIKKKGAK